MTALPPTSSSSTESDGAPGESVGHCREVGFKWYVNGDAAGVGECGFALPCPEHGPTPGGAR